VRQILLAASIALIVSLLGTPAAIRILRRRGYGQEIRAEGPESHQSKRGTPTMGGTVIILATLLGYGVSHLFFLGGGTGPTASGLLVLGLMTGLGLVGFLDDFIKIFKARNLGLNKTSKLVGQLVVAVGFGVLALQFPDANGLTPASDNLSFVRDTALAFGVVGFVAFAYFLISGFSNAVNLTDGLDGLAAGSAAMAFGSYVVISFWMFGNRCTGDLPDGGPLNAANCYTVRDPLDVALVAAAAMGACFGFLWWNAGPAKIFMGDTGSLAIGGALAGIAVVTRTELLLVILGGLFVVETLSVMMQVAAFRLTKRRVFNMAPLHHHFELAGWAENTVIVRFWIIAGLAAAFGLGVFYAEYLSLSSLG
jgi:phospho-N-acetylmuramoyl-pentapeptide-transferase